MFIELEDVGVNYDKKGNIIGVNEAAEEHGRPLMLKVDNIIYFHPRKLQDGNVITEIEYTEGTFWVKTSYGAIKTMLNNIGFFEDDTIEPVEEPKKEYDFSGSPKLSTDTWLDFFSHKDKK